MIFISHSSKSRKSSQPLGSNAKLRSNAKTKRSLYKVNVYKND